jgi:hypothetical protein
MMPNNSAEIKRNRNALATNDPIRNRIWTNNQNKFVVKSIDR